MGKDNNIGIVILLAIIAIVAFGGAKNYKNTGPVTADQNKANVEKKLAETKTQVEELKKQIQIEEDKKTQSKYYGVVKLLYINRSDKPESEFLALHVDDNYKEAVPITGWKIRSVNSNINAIIPSGTQLLFTGMINREDPILVYAGDNIYVNTGYSPNGLSFRINKCSGYLTQFQEFTPYISSNCPRPADEDLSSIPRLAINDACFDYIDSFPYCKIQTESLPKNWSVECSKFIYDKINYSSCINTHKGDSDFYKKEWRIYLKRGDILWRARNQNIILYDNEDKIVSTLKY